MKKIIWLNLLVLFPVTLWGTITFEKWYPSTGRGYSVKQTFDGGYIITGERDHLMLMKTDSLGNMLWYKEYYNTNNDCGYSIQETSDLGFIITGVTYPESLSRNALLLKTNIYGDSLWTKTYGGNLSDYGRYAIETSDGGYTVTGSYGSPSNDYDVYLIRTNSVGDTIWTRAKGGGGNDNGMALRRTADMGYIILGNTTSYGPGNPSIYLIKTDSIGITLWQKTYGGNSSNYGQSIQKFQDGGFIIAGRTTSFGAGANDVYLIRTDSTGDTIWTKTYGGLDDDFGYSIVTTHNNNCVVVGHTQSYGAGGIDIYLIKTDSLGNLLWQKTYGGNNDELGRDIQKTQDGGYIIVGYREWGVYLIKTDSLGYVGTEEKLYTTPIQSNTNVYPNPFFHTLHIHGDSSIQIFDIAGKFITEVKEQWNGKDAQGRNIPPGIYFLKADGKPVGKVVKVR